jgi:RNA polymerase sigma factor (sigma-70 family)
MSDADTLKIIEMVTKKVLARLVITQEQREEVESICTLEVLTQLKNCDASGKLPLRRYLCLKAYSRSLAWLRGEKEAQHEQLTGDLPEPCRGDGSGVTPSELSEAIDKLPADQQRLIRLRHIDGLKLREIAECTQRTTSLVAHQLGRAQKALKELLGE